MFKRLQTLWLSFTAFLASVFFSNAFAQSTGLDVSSAVTEISGAKDPVMAIGAAVFAVLVAAALWKWIRRGL